MLTGIGAPTAWPFFQKARKPQPARTPLGQFQATLTDILDLPSLVDMDAGEVVIVSTASDSAAASPTVEVTIDANVLTQDIAFVGGGNLLGTMNHWVCPAATFNMQVTATWTAGVPGYVSMVVCKVTNLTGVFNEQKTAAFASTGNPDSGITSLYPEPGFHYGAICLIGKSSDALGAWQNGMSAGTRVGSLAVHLDHKTGYKISNGPAQAQILGQAARQCVALIGHYG